jgi:hypothetical protein
MIGGVGPGSFFVVAPCLVGPFSKQTALTIPTIVRFSDSSEFELAVS